MTILAFLLTITHRGTWYVVRGERIQRQVLPNLFYFLCKLSSDFYVINIVRVLDNLCSMGRADHGSPRRRSISSVALTLVYTMLTNPQGRRCQALLRRFARSISLSLTSLHYRQLPITKLVGLCYMLAGWLRLGETSDLVLGPIKKRAGEHLSSSCSKPLPLVD